MCESEGRTDEEAGWRSETVCAAILRLLDDRAIPYELREHAPVRTAEDAARFRGEPLEIGGKTLLIKVAREFRLFVLSAARQLDSRAIQRRFRTGYTRFATEPELREIVGAKPGSVPPFGEPIVPLPLFVDPSIREQARIAFNPGMRTRSVLMSTDDYMRIAEPTEIFPFSRGPL